MPHKISEVGLRSAIIWRTAQVVLRPRKTVSYLGTVTEEEKTEMVNRREFLASVAAAPVSAQIVA